MKTLIKGGMVLKEKNGNYELEKNNIVIEKDKILEITKKLYDNKNINKIIDAKNCLIIPGLINSHNHSYANLLKGTTENLPLEIWMKYCLASGVKQTPREVYINTMLGSIQMLKTGTTAVLDQLALDEEGLKSTFKAYEDVGMRATVAPMIMDKHYFETLPNGQKIFPKKLQKNIRKQLLLTPNELIDICKKVIRDYNGKEGRLYVTVAPSGPHRCSEELLKKSIELAENEDVGIHTHLLETKTQAVTAYEMYGKSMTEFLNEIGFLQPRTSLAHAIWLSDREIEILADSGASVIHNPLSNLILGSGIAPILKFLKANINIGIGTDGVNCGGNQILFEAMRFAATIHKVKSFNFDTWITAEQVLNMAYSGGAKIFLKENEIARIEKGYKADIVILDTNSVSLTPINNVVNLLVYSENGSSVRDVIINGNLVVENKKLTRVNEDKILAEARENIKKLKPKIIELYNFYDIQGPYIDKIYEQAINKDIGFNRLIQ